MDESGACVIVGGGQAGGRAAETLREAGFEGPIVIVAGERHRPYERPPLSKQVLTGDAEAEIAFLRPPDFYEKKGIELRLDAWVTGIDRAGGRVLLQDGATLAYSRLLLATGARPRHIDLPGARLPGVHLLRDMDQSLALRKVLQNGGRLVVVGGGYIGLEVAASARKCGCAVTVLEAADGLMRRQVAPELGDWYADLHRRHGVEIKLRTSVAGFEGKARVDAVFDSDGCHYPADAVVVGVGVLPNVELAQQAGLKVDNGIVVDSTGRSSDPAIFAAGDVTNHPNGILGRRLRLESWQNAQNQAIAAARTMAGQEREYTQVPWFWTDQYDVNLQMVGLPEQWDRLVWRGKSEEQEPFTLFYLDSAGRVVSANAVNNGGDIAPARKLIETGVRPDPIALSDPDVSLKKVIKNAV